MSPTKKKRLKRLKEREKKGRGRLDQEASLKNYLHHLCMIKAKEKRLLFNATLTNFIRREKYNYHIAYIRSLP